MDMDRRFGGINRLYCDTALQTLQEAHVCVVGLGGVGSWAVETLVRAGLQKLTLIDLDQVVESNINRQAQALESTLGMAKTDALLLRIHDINPECEVVLHEDFVTSENVETYFPSDGSCAFDWVIDAIDQLRVKAALIAHARKNQISLITTGAAGGKTDPRKIVCKDLASTSYDPLCARLRTLLRKQYQFPAAPKKFQVPCVYSTQEMRRPETCDQGASGLNCNGYGSLMGITAMFGIMAATMVINHLLEAKNDSFS